MEDFEEARNAAVEEIDWKQMKKDMANLRFQIDSMLTDIDKDLDIDVVKDMDLDMDLDVDLDVDPIR